MGLSDHVKIKMQLLRCVAESVDETETKPVKDAQFLIALHLGSLSDVQVYREE